MDTFKELTPEEQKLALIQFLGQHVTGEMKEIDKNLVSQSSSLRGINIDPVSLVKSIPGSSNPVATVVNAGINVARNNKVVPQQQQSQPTTSPVFYDPDQLEFDFNNCDYAKQIFNRLDAIDLKLDKILKSFKD